MRNVIRYCLLFFLIICFNYAHAQNEDSITFSLRVVVEGISKPEGTLIVGVADKQNFERGNIRGCNQKVPVTNQTMEINFNNLKSGEYAILVVVKEEKLDSLKAQINPFEEQTGFSQNIRRPWKAKIEENGKVILSFPDFDTVKFQIPQKRTMRILLGNPSKSVQIIN